MLDVDDTDDREVVVEVLAEVVAEETVELGVRDDAAVVDGWVSLEGSDDRFVSSLSRSSCRLRSFSSWRL